jgi:hypothetical protein
MDLRFIEKCIKVYGDQTSLHDLLNILNNTEYIDIYTDGATQFDGKDRKSGIGIYFTDNDKRNISKIINVKDNNEAEIIACIEALKIIFININRF